MAERILSRDEIPVTCEGDVVTVRRRAQAVAHERGLGTFAVAAVTTAASELARNIIAHASDGAVIIEAVARDGRNGVRMVFRDKGPGIADLSRALAGGFSTAKSLGLGLSGSKRLVDEFHVDTAPGAGTVVTVVKWARY
ncbi:MAG: anti-sigma regulatory factor [Deltaproteobacteria bacterium]|nr:anti-sigma regulatory factor [Kofleriaceae bacterium]